MKVSISISQQIIFWNELHTLLPNWPSSFVLIFKCIFKLTILEFRSTEIKRNSWYLFFQNILIDFYLGSLFHKSWCWFNCTSGEICPINQALCHRYSQLQKTKANLKFSQLLNFNLENILGDLSFVSLDISHTIPSCKC